MLEISHIQAQTLRGLLHRAKALLSTVESADNAFLAEVNAVMRDAQSWERFLLERMQEASPALTKQYADNGSEANK